MAKLKYNLVNGQTKFVLKEGKVSCSCCAEEIPDFCCMYPSDKINVLYREEDLPTEVYSPGFNFTSDKPTVLLERDGLIYGPHNYGDSANRLVLDNLPQFVSGWSFEFQFDEEFGWESQDRSNCLFVWNEPQPVVPGGNGYGDGAGRVYDNFQDEYTASCTIGDQIVTRTLVRENLCSWVSRNENGDVDSRLYYRTLATEAEAQQSGLGRILWRYNGSYRTDEGPFNSPAGTYGSCEVL